MSESPAHFSRTAAEGEESEEKPFHLSGNFAPIFEERTDFDLEVTGAIPPELEGRFYRNGSNPKSGWSAHWFLGNGMIHAVELEDGKAISYRNRYVDTPLLEDPSEGRVRSDGTVDRKRSYANTHVISHGGKILALEEGAFPYELTPNLDTVGPHDFSGVLDTAMTAHPRVCPETGELLFFAAPSREDHITYYRASPEGRITQREEIQVKGSTMMHDWSVTRNHSIFMDLPMVFDPDALANGGIPVRWSDDYGARLGVMPRHGTNDDVTWYEIDPCYVFHPMNSYEEGDKIILDVARFEKLAFSPADGEGTPPILHRWTIDQATGRVSGEPMADQPGEFPRVHDRVVGLKHRFGYMVGMGQVQGTLGSCLRKYDVETGNALTHALGEGRQAGEPVFAPCPGASGEDEGWVITYVYDAATDKSDLVIIDASNFEDPPVARIHMKTRVPFGFHGSWVSAGN